MSLSQAEIKRLKSLNTKKGRRTAGQFSAEGVRLIEQAYRFKFRPAGLYYAESLLSDRGTLLLERFSKRGIEVTPVSARDIGRIGDTSTSPGLLAVFRTPSVNLRKLYQPRMRSILLCENISDPGNLGTLIRSAAAFGFDLIVLAGQCAEPYSPKVVRSSVGAIFALPIAVTSTEDAIEFTGREQVAIVGTDIKGEDHMIKTAVRLRTKRTLLALGSEARGLSGDLLKRADFTVRVRHERSVESLNAAVAGSILMQQWYETVLRRK